MVLSNFKSNSYLLFINRGIKYLVYEIIMEVLMENNGYRISMLIRQVDLKINQHINNEVKKIGFTVPQVALIKVLSRNEKMKLGDLSEEMNLANSTISGIVDRLEANGMVERIRCSEDKRVVYVALSKKGKAFAAQFRGIINEYFEGMFQGVSKEKIDVILKGLETLVKVIDK